MLYTETAHEVVIHVFDLWFYPEPLFRSLHTKNFKFLSQRELYNAKKSGEITLGNKTLDIRPLGRRYYEKNKFWESYRSIDLGGVVPYTRWDRQEPFKLNIPFRITPLKYQKLKIYTYPPEAFLFPSGWASLFKFSFNGPLKINKLSNLISQFFSEPLFSIHNTPTQGLKLDDLLNRVTGIIRSLVYINNSCSGQAQRLLGNVLVTIVDRQNPKPHHTYTTKDKQVLFSSILGYDVPLRSLYEIEGKFSKIAYSSGQAVFNYEKGLFLDLPQIQSPQRKITRRSISCLSKNIRDMIIMVTLLKQFINTGVRRVPKINSKSSKKDKEFHQLLVNSQKVLNTLAENYNNRIAKCYVQNHTGIKKAMNISIK